MAGIRDDASGIELLLYAHPEVGYDTNGIQRIRVARSGLCCVEASALLVECSEAEGWSPASITGIGLPI
jgi:hypothetical protein